MHLVYDSDHPVVGAHNQASTAHKTWNVEDGMDDVRVPEGVHFDTWPVTLQQRSPYDSRPQESLPA